MLLLCTSFLQLSPKPPSFILRTQGMDGLKKSDARSGSAETGLKTDDHGNGRQESFSGNSK